jgi:hypothetical protein
LQEVSTTHPSKEKVKKSTGLFTLLSLGFAFMGTLATMEAIRVSNNLREKRRRRKLHKGRKHLMGDKLTTL